MERNVFRSTETPTASFTCKYKKQSSYKEKGEIVLTDGDRMLVLFCCVIKKILEHIYGKTSIPLKIGVVQTAYANSGSTRYIKDVLEVSFKVSIASCGNSSYRSKVPSCKS